MARLFVFMAKDKKGKHKSLGKDLKLSVNWLESLDSISKIVLDRTESCRHRYSAGHIRFQMDVDGGVKAKGYSGNGIVDIFIKIDPIEDRELIKAKISKKFE